MAKFFRRSKRDNERRFVFGPAGGRAVMTRRRSAPPTTKRILEEEFKKTPVKASEPKPKPKPEPKPEPKPDTAPEPSDALFPRDEEKDAYDELVAELAMQGIEGKNWAGMPADTPEEAGDVTRLRGALRPIDYRRPRYGSNLGKVVSKAMQSNVKSGALKPQAYGRMFDVIPYTRVPGELGTDPDKPLDARYRVEEGMQKEGFVGHKDEEGNPLPVVTFKSKKGVERADFTSAVLNQAVRLQKLRDELANAKSEEDRARIQIELDREENVKHGGFSAKQWHKGAFERRLKKGQERLREMGYPWPGSVMSQPGSTEEHEAWHHPLRLEPKTQVAWRNLHAKAERKKWPGASHYLKGGGHEPAQQLARAKAEYYEITSNMTTTGEGVLLGSENDNFEKLIEGKHDAILEKMSPQAQRAIWNTRRIIEAAKKDGDKRAVKELIKQSKILLDSVVEADDSKKSYFGDLAEQMA